MIDKIQSGLSANHSGDVPHVEGRPASVADKGRRSDGTSAEVQLSQEARDLQRLVQTVHDAPDVREDLVNEIRTQIEQGTYQIDVQALARRLMPLLR